MYSMTSKNQKKAGLYKALAKNPALMKEYINQYTQGQMDFPDELVEAFTQAQGDVKKVEQMCTNLKKSKEGAQLMKVMEQVYSAAQQQIDTELNGSGLFKDGGKLNYLRYLAGGGPVETNPYVFQSDTVKVSPTKTIISQRFTPGTKDKNGQVSYGDWDQDSFRVITKTPQGQSVKYYGTPGWGDNDYMQYGSGENSGYMPVSGEEVDQETAKSEWLKRLWGTNVNDYGRGSLEKVRQEHPKLRAGNRIPNKTNNPSLFKMNTPPAQTGYWVPSERQGNPFDKYMNKYVEEEATRKKQPIKNNQNVGLQNLLNKLQ